MVIKGLEWGIAKAPEISAAYAIRACKGVVVGLWYGDSPFLDLVDEREQIDPHLFPHRLLTQSCQFPQFMQISAQHPLADVLNWLDLP